MTIKLHTCVGIIVSRMLLIVSIVSGGEAVLLFSLLRWPWLGVLDWLTVGCWSDSLPNVMSAFPETSDKAIKKKSYQTSATSSWYVYRVSFTSYLITSAASSSESYIFHARFEFGQQRRGREGKKRKQKILSILFKYPHCTCLSTSTSLTHRPFALAKQLWDLSLYLF